MPLNDSRVSGWLTVLVALTGFAIAEPVFDLLNRTPEFLVARQNTVFDVALLAISLSIILPFILALPAWLSARRYPRCARAYTWLLASILCTCLGAQIVQPLGDIPGVLFLLLALSTAIPLSYLLLFTRWKMLASVLALIALIFPLKFLFYSPVIENVRGLPESSFTLQDLEQAPDIVFVVFDELPLATMLDNDLQIDGRLFPGFKRLQNISNWYFNTTSIADSTMFSVPAMLTGRYPEETDEKPTIAEQPVNLFTLLRGRYSYNVVEPVTRLCPSAQCAMTGPGGWSRFRALLLDLLAVYLHRVTPPSWQDKLPDVDSNWSGFFAERQIFFPEGWLEHMEKLVEVDRLSLFRRFISSVKAGESLPVLNFVHILLPHEPLAYLADGENYGLVWMRGRTGERWDHHEWGIASARQRFTLQAQLADRLLDELLSRLEAEAILESSLLVVVSDHGTSFLPGDQKRVLSDENAAGMLRVPLFIKPPGSMTGQRITFPAMTIDILPTVLSQLGVDVSPLELTGIDLGGRALPEGRARMAHSYASGQTKMRPISEDNLAVEELTAGIRDELKLDDEARSLWGIGPFGAYRGENLRTLCAEEEDSLSFSLSGARPLPGSESDVIVPAFIAGSVKGPGVPEESTPFVISSHGVIAASGMTWLLRDDWLFFALVEPSLVKQENWAPEVALVVDGVCLR